MVYGDYESHSSQLHQVYVRRGSASNYKCLEDGTKENVCTNCAKAEADRR
jgi:hypothetical protein